MRLKVSNVCQLYDKTYPATQTVNGVTFTNNGDGSVTVNGTASNTATAEGEFLRVNPGDRILMFSGYDIGGLKTAFVYCSQWDENKHWIADLGYPSLLGRISTCGKNTRYIRYTYRVDTGNTATNAVIKLQLFNLTEMYGAGNEPTTVAQFRQDFPNEMYDYSPECWKKFRRLKYVTETKNLFKFSNEVGTLNGGFGPNVARNFEEGKWYIGFTTNNYYSPNNIIAYSFKDNLIYYNGYGAGYGLSRAFKCEPNSNYNISCLTIGISGSGLGYIYAGFYDESGNYISNNNIEINNRSFTTPANCKWLIITLSTRGVAEVYFKDIQVEKGSTATPYQPYGYLPLNRGKYIANKEPYNAITFR